MQWSVALGVGLLLSQQAVFSLLPRGNEGSTCQQAVHEEVRRSAWVVEA
jgi:hypothetical protein